MKTAETVTRYVVQQRVASSDRWLDVRSEDNLTDARLHKQSLDAFHRQPEHEVPMQIASRVIERRVTTVEEVMP